MPPRAKRYASWDIPPEGVFEAIERLCASRRWRVGRDEPAPQWVIEKIKAVKRRKAKAAALEAGERRREAQRVARRARYAPAFSIVSRMLLAMQPGQWYARSDLMRAANVGRPARGKVNQRLLALGFVERRRNPKYRGPVVRAGGYRHFVEPEFLYRLTAAGELKREALQLLE